MRTSSYLSEDLLVNRGGGKRIRNGNTYLIIVSVAVLDDVPTIKLQLQNEDTDYPALD